MHILPAYMSIQPWRPEDGATDSCEPPHGLVLKTQT